MPPEVFPAGTALVGGAVRDGLLGRLVEQPDLDLVVHEDAISLCRRLCRQHGGACVVLDQGRSMARWVLQGWSLDLARCEGPDLGQDLARRDYTINAMALPLAVGAPLFDPLGGLTDLAAGQLVAIREANLLDDPLRLLRGPRLAAELGFRLEPRTWAWICRHHQRLVEVAPERVLAELERLAAAPSGERGLALAIESGLLQPWSHAKPPELERLSAAAATGLGLDAAEQAQALPLARLSALCHGAALERLHSSRRLQQRTRQLQRWQQHLRGGDPEHLPDQERLQLHLELESDLPALLLLLSLPAERARQWLQRWRNSNDPLFHPRSPLNGRELQQALALNPSPQLGQLIRHLTLERAFGRLSSREDTLAAARLWLQGHQR